MMMSLFRKEMKLTWPLFLSVMTSTLLIMSEIIESEALKVCKGTNIGGREKHHWDAYFLTNDCIEDYRRRYENCTHVLGNLEIFGIEHNETGEENELSFLQDITEVTGYVFISNVELKKVIFPSLRIIRGRTLFRFSPEDPEYSLLVDESKIEFLQFPVLTEIIKGSAAVYSKNQICNLGRVNWEDILMDENATFHHFLLNYNPLIEMFEYEIASFSNCPPCHESCQGGCWSGKASGCQNFSRTNCSSECGEGRCFGEGRDECCHQLCTGGCKGPRSSDCVSCKGVYYDGECRDKCPPGFYSVAGTDCVSTCQYGALQDKEEQECVASCPHEKHATDGICRIVHPPEKKCRAPSDMFSLVHAGNIEHFENCTILEGDILINDETFEGGRTSSYNVIYNMDPRQLKIFSSLREVYGQILIENTFGHNFTNLNCFRNLEVIQTRASPCSHLESTEYALRIQYTSLEGIDFGRLERVNGKIYIYENRELCYVERDWYAVSTQNVYLGDNKGIQECQARYKCHQNCKGGCSGPLSTLGDFGCNSCRLAMVHRNGTVECTGNDIKCPQGFYVPDLPEIISRGIFQEPLKCFECAAECRECIGPTSSDCSICSHFRVYNGSDVDGWKWEGDLQNDFTCVDKCPSEFPLPVEKPNAQPYCKRPAPNFLSLNLLAVIAGVSVLFVLGVGVICLYRRWKKTKEDGDCGRDRGWGLPQSTASTSLNPNLSKFRLITEGELRRDAVIGSGTFGKVHRGMWIPERRVKISVAIKTLRGARGPEETRSFVDEAHLMARIEHPHLLNLLGLCMGSSEMMLVTQLMPLGSLRHYLVAHKNNIGSHAMLTWCTQIARGMAYLEDHRVVHRDLAARNVLVEAPSCVKITDFGLAKLLKFNEDGYLGVRELLPVKWMALESLQMQTFTHKSDVWAFGVTIWEILTCGGIPFGDVSVDSISSRLVQGERLEQPSYCSTDLYTELLKMWLPDPECRPSFPALASTFAEMCQHSGNYICIPEDDEKKLPEYTVEDERALIRKLASKNDNSDELLSIHDYYTRIEANTSASDQSTACHDIPVTNKESRLKERVPYYLSLHENGSNLEETILEEVELPQLNHE